MAIDETEQKWLGVVHTSDMLWELINFEIMEQSSLEERKRQAGNLVKYLENEKLDDTWTSRDWTTIDQRIADGRSFWQS